MTSSGSHQLGIDVGGTHIKWTLLDTEVVADQGEEDTAKQGGLDLVHQIADLVRRLGTQATSIGLAMPGLVDSVRSETVFIPNIPGDWSGYPIATQIQELASCPPVRVVNDARAFAYGEFHAGIGRDYMDAVFMTIGTGVGGALAQHGEVVIGENDCFPEIGHIPVEINGERCGCGATGCLETVASASAVIGRCARAVLTGQSSILAKLTGGELSTLTARMVSEAADAGDPWAQDALEQTGTYLGMAAASACLVTNANTVIIGGGLSGAVHHLRPAIERVLAERHRVLGRVEVLQAQLGPYAGSVGAALYAHHLDNPPTRGGNPTSDMRGDRRK